MFGSVVTPPVTFYLNHELIPLRIYENIYIYIYIEGFVVRSPPCLHPHDIFTRQFFI